MHIQHPPATLLISIPARAPDLHSSVTCHVYGSPLVFSDSASSGVGGNALAHRPNILGRKWRTVEGPEEKFKSKHCCILISVRLLIYKIALSYTKRQPKKTLAYQRAKQRLFSQIMERDPYFRSNDYSPHLKSSGHP